MCKIIVVENMFKWRQPVSNRHCHKREGRGGGEGEAEGGGEGRVSAPADEIQ